MIQIKNIQPISLLIFLVCFAIPLNDVFSTIMLIALTAFLIGSYIRKQGNSSKYFQNLVEHWRFILIPASLLILRILALLIPGVDASELDNAVRAIPFVWFPLLFFAAVTDSPDKEFEKLAFQGLFYGCLSAWLICEVNVIYEWLVNSEPLEYLFRWRHLNIQFTNILGIHPPYLGYLTIVVLFWLFLNKPKFYEAGILVLLLFLFQLLARNSIVFLFISICFFILYRRDYKMGITIFLLGAILFTIAWNHPSKYLKSKIETILVFNKPNNRFSRLSASYKTFLERPWLGGGKKYAEDRRVYFYHLDGDTRAVDQKLNAHNQYMEYLSTYGLFGLTVFLIVIAFAIYLARTSSIPALYQLVTGAFLFACLTESMLERSLGIKSFSLILALLIVNRLKIESTLAKRETKSFHDLAHKVSQHGNSKGSPVK